MRVWSGGSGKSRTSPAICSKRLIASGAVGTSPRTVAPARRYYGLLEQAAGDDDVRVIVVTGAGRGWCAGADMDTLQGNAEADDSDAGLDRPIWFPTPVPKPIIAAVNGACAGIGL